MRIIEVNGHVLELEIYHQYLNLWGKENFRSFPWRETSNSYYILLSEVMLHRTQAKQVQSVFGSFIKKYPDLKSLSQATKNDLHEILFSLGLRWRIDSMYDMVQELIIRFNGKVPYEKKDLLSLPGVSEYIVSAVRCFAWDIAVPIIDTNTVRIAGRLFGLGIKDSSRRNQQFKKLIRDLLDIENPRIYNYALLDLANQICTKRSNPDCYKCPLLKMCRHGYSITH